MPDAAINELLGCSKMISSEKCAPNPTNTITCDCNLEKVCRVTEMYIYSFYFNRYISNNSYKFLFYLTVD